MGQSKCSRMTPQEEPWSDTLAFRPESLRLHQLEVRRSESMDPRVLAPPCKSDNPCIPRRSASLAASICHSCHRSLQTGRYHPDQRTHQGSWFPRRNTRQELQQELRMEKFPLWPNVLDGRVPWDRVCPSLPEDKRHCLKVEHLI